MSLSGATRALGSSIIDGLFSGSRARGKGGAAPAAPRKCALVGAQSEAGGVDPAVPPIGAKWWKIVVYEPLTRDFARRPRRQLVPARPTFFLIYQFNLPRFRGSFSGVGDHSLSSGLEGAGVDAVVALGRAACAPVPAGRLHPRVIGRGEFHLAGQLVTVVRHPRAVVARRTPIRLPPPPRRPAIARVLRRSAIVLGAVLSRAVFGVKPAAGALLVAVVALAIMHYRDPEPAATGVEPADNETVVYRRAAPAHARSEETKPADQGDEAGSQYPRAVQTVRFVNPDPPLSITAAAREMIKRALIKVGAFVAFPARESSEPETVEMRRKRGTVVLDGIDDYLWEVYQRAPTKKDSTGDFTWKDPTAAKRMGLSLQDYVIGGMAPAFREQLYNAGRAMDADGINWSMLSAFRDDYRQRLAAGFKARGGNSLHGGSRRTGGYGHGRAVDVTAGEGTNSEDVWKWIDAHGAKYGLARPMPGNDPAHVQQRGESGGVASTFRQKRSRVADAGKRQRHKARIKVANAK